MVWKRHKKVADDGTWDRIFAQILAETDAAGGIDWPVSWTRRRLTPIDTFIWIISLIVTVVLLYLIGEEC
jgi:hypothetical protein